MTHYPVLEPKKRTLSKRMARVPAPTQFWCASKGEMEQVLSLAGTDCYHDKHWSLPEGVTIYQLVRSHIALKRRKSKASYPHIKLNPETSFLLMSGTDLLPESWVA